MKSKIKEILKVISWREFANIYFQRSPLWFYEKLEGNEHESGFSLEEIYTLKHGLLDLSERIKRVANSI